MAEVVRRIEQERLGVRQKLQLIVVDRIYDCIDDERVQNFLGKLAQFKISAYLDEWSYGVLPIDQADYFATHIALLHRTEQKDEILMSYKVVTQDRCNDFRVSFPALSAIEGTTEALKYRPVIERMIADADSKNQKLAYIGSWAIQPKAKRSRVFARFCRDISTASIVHYCRDFGIQEGLAFAVTRLKVDRYHASIGWTPLLDDKGEALPEFKSRAYKDEGLTLSKVRLSNYSDEALQAAAEYADLWKHRIHISPETMLLKEKKAA